LRMMHRVWSRPLDGCLPPSGNVNGSSSEVVSTIPSRYNYQCATTPRNQQDVTKGCELQATRSRSPQLSTDGNARTPPPPPTPHPPPPVPRPPGTRLPRLSRRALTSSHVTRASLQRGRAGHDWLRSAAQAPQGRAEPSPSSSL
jgi:hypothetical protein